MKREAAPRAWLATECSAFDQGAHAVALGLAGHAGATLQAVLPLLSNAEYESVAPQTAALAEAELLRRSQALKADAARQGVSLTLTVRRGPDLAEEILAHARDNAEALMVIRRRGERGFLAQLLIGEMVSAVLSGSPGAVVVCPRDARLWQRGVLVAIDPEVGPAPSFLHQAMTLAMLSAVPVHLVSMVSTAHQRAAARARLDDALQQLADWGLRAQGHALDGSVAHGIPAAVRALNCDLLVVARDGAGGPSAAGISRTVGKLIAGADCPVLVHRAVPLLA